MTLKPTGTDTHRVLIRPSVWMNRGHTHVVNWPNEYDTQWGIHSTHYHTNGGYLATVFRDKEQFKLWRAVRPHSLILLVWSDHYPSTDWDSLVHKTCHTDTPLGTVNGHGTTTMAIKQHVYS